MARVMRDSGIEWIGKMPATWSISRLKYIGRYINGYAFKPEQWGDKGKLIIRIQDLTGSNDNPNYYDGEIDDKYFIHNGDILVSWAATLDAFIWNKGDGLLNQHIFKAVHNPKYVCYEYFFWLIKVAMEYMNNDNKHGIVMQHVTLDVFGNFAVVLPPIEEQSKISKYLEKECVRIDAVMEQTRASIEEYKKLKQSVITKAVTKGIRPNRPMKDSGVDWIGKVPTDWQIAKLKYFCSIRSGITLGKIYPSDIDLVEYPYLRVANVQGSYTDLSDVATIMVTEEEAEKYRLHDGELLMTEGGDRDKLGRGTVWHAEIDPCLHQNHIFALRTKENLSAEYVSYLSASAVGRDYFDVTANQSVHLASTNSTTIMNFSIPLPTIEEQNEIILGSSLQPVGRE